MTELVSEGPRSQDVPRAHGTHIARLLTKPAFALGLLVFVAALILWEADVARPMAPVGTSPLVHAGLVIGATIASYAFAATVCGRRAAVYGVVVLLAMPSWFIRARVDASLHMMPTIVLACLGIALFEARLPVLARGSLVGVAAASALLGARSVGLLLTVAVPSIAVGGGWLLGGQRHSRQRRTLAWTLLVVGVTVALACVATSKSSLAPLLLGPRTNAASFARPVARVAYGLAPWTPLLPFALAGRPREGDRSRIFVFVAVLTVALESTASPHSGASTYAAPALAATVGALLAELDRQRSPATLLGVGVISIGAIIAHDLSLSPDRVVDALGVSVATGQAVKTARALRIAVWCVSGATALFTILKGSVDLRELDPRRVGAGPVFRTHGGPLLLGPGLVVVLVGLATGLVLRLHAYPELLQRISPGRAFEIWTDRRKTGDQLGLFALDQQRWPTSESDPITLSDPEAVTDWLVDSTPARAESRRFIATTPSGLARVNAAYRRRRGDNLPVIAGEGAFLLGVSRLAFGEQSESPLDAIVRSSPPPDLRPLRAHLGTSLDVLGWNVTDAMGNATLAIPRRKTAHVRIAVQVHGEGAGATRERALAGHCTFLHVDHTPTRYGAEHREHPYPMSSWGEGDVVIDDFEIDLPAHFTIGSYPIYWGVGILPCQDDRRMPITAGPNDGHHRVPLGRLEVR